MGSAALQCAASLQLRAVFRDPHSPEALWGEDHVYEYFFPVQPWQNVGSAAQFFGAGSLLRALGIAAMKAGALIMPAAATRRRAVLIENAVAGLTALGL